MAGRKSKSQRSRSQAERRRPVSKGGERALEETPTRAGEATEVPGLVGATATLVGLVSVAALSGLLAMFQWMELLLSAAGHVSFCQIDDVFNCSAVWQAPWAKWWGGLTGVPVAGWGLIWSVIAFGVALWITAQRLKNDDETTAAAGVRLVAAAGVLPVVVLGGYAVSLGQICLTCVLTYGLVGVYGALAWVLPTPVTFDLARYRTAALTTAAGAVLVYGLIAAVAAGGDEREPSPTPAVVEGSAPDGPRRDEVPRGDSDVAAYIQSLAPSARRTLAEGLTAYRQASAPELPPLTERPFVGRDDAPVRMTDFSDLRCPHCATLAASMARIVDQMPPGMLRLESRYFPLDGSCNPKLDPKFVDPSGVRCFAPKVLLCCQDAAEYEALRLRMFREQPTLTVEGVLAMAQQVVGRSASDLEACVADPATARRLQEDIEYAARFDIRGTPMMVLNGRRILAFAPLLTAMILAEGDPNHPGFSQLAAR